MDLDSLFSEDNTYPLMAAAILGLLTFILIVWAALGAGGGGGQKKNSEVAEPDKDEETKSETVNSSGSSQAKGKKIKVKPVSKKVTLPTHPLLAADFKGHTDAVMSIDIDPNGKFLASCSEDRTLRLWYLDTLTDKEHKYVRKNTAPDYSQHIKFSPDGTAVVTLMAVDNNIQVFRITKQKGGVVSLSDTGVEFPKISSSEGVLALDIASTGRYIMTCTSTAFTIWTLKGDILATTQTNHAPNTCAAISPCGKFIACAGFTPDVKLWEVEYSKGGDFQQVSRVMELKGHNASVLSLGFSGDSHRMATVSKDGTWKLWDIDVRYHLKEDPKSLITVNLPDQSYQSILISLSPDALVVAIATTVGASSSILLYLTSSGDLMINMEDIHRDVTSLCWAPSSEYLYSSGGGDRHVRVWHNAPGMKEVVREMKSKVTKTSSEALKRRLEQQISDTEDRLKAIGQL